MGKKVVILSDEEYRKNVKLISAKDTLKEGLHNLYVMAINGHPKAQFVCGMIFYSGYKSIKHNEKFYPIYFKYAFADLTSLSDRGDGEATCMLAYYSYYGFYNVPKDEDQAIKLFEKATTLGDSYAANFLASYYKKRKDTEKSTAYANIALDLEEKEKNGEINHTLAPISDNESVISPLEENKVSSASKNINDIAKTSNKRQLGSSTINSIAQISNKQEISDTKDALYSNDALPEILDVTRILTRLLNKIDVDLSHLSVDEKYELANKLTPYISDREDLKVIQNDLYDKVHMDLHENTLNREPQQIRYLAEIYFNGLGIIDENKEQGLYYYAVSANRGDKVSIEFLNNYRNVNSKTDENNEVSKVETTKVNAPTPVQKNETISTEKEDERHIFTETVPSCNGESTDEGYLNYMYGEYIKAKGRSDEDLFNIIRTLNKDNIDENTFRINLEMLENNAKNGSIDSMLLCAEIYKTETRWNIKNQEKVAYYYKLAETKGSVTAKFELGKLYIESTSGVLHNFDSGFELVKESAKRGYNIALSYLGDLYFDGKFVERSLTKARHYYKLAADRNLGSAYYKLSLIDDEEGIDSSINLENAYRHSFTFEKGDDLQSKYLLPTLDEMSSYVSASNK